ncbi:porin family protein [Zeaxanthinibacter sp. PT1]|uniref:porin family protein n=1 Tax=Zeaxanthinibacter TaxID=561554 RepID=UPI00234B9790|nr:porin family protein [Zeaxanthinibacter sp. PT1]MDC6350215.1 porin family protein [Zeaxanthinibacter sp. PT1]
MKDFFLLLVFCCTFTLCAQTVPPVPPAQDSLIPDPDYLEDQFYVGLAYNILLNKPEGVKQRNLSYGLQGGFIKDIPLNLKRNVAIGIGLGYAVNSYYSNLRATENAEDFNYEVIPDNFSYKRNKIETHLIELPLELRLRNSDPVDYKFWRFYGGIKLGYVVGSRSKIVTKDFKDSFYNTDTDNFRYGLMVNLGYNTFNIHAYYALNTLFEPGKASVNGEEIGMTPLRIGLIFYIL